MNKWVRDEYGGVSVAQLLDYFFGNIARRLPGGRVSLDLLFLQNIKPSLHVSKLDKVALDMLGGLNNVVY